MAKQKKTAYCLLAAALLLCASMVLGVTNTHSNYRSAACWNTILQPNRASRVDSDCLVPGGQIVMLKPIVKATEVEIQCWADGPLDGILTWEYANKLQQPLLDVELEKTGVSLDEEKTSVILYLTPTKEATALVNDQELDILVTLDAGDQVLEGTFRVLLPGLAEPERPESPEQPGGPDDAYEVTEDTQQVEFDFDSVEVSMEQSNTETDGTEPGGEEGASGDAGSGESDPENGDPEAGDGENTGAAEESRYELLGSFDTTTLGEFSVKASLPILMDFPWESERFRLRLEEDSLPAHTRYSPDGGETWYMLYYGGAINMDTDELITVEGSECLLLDLTYTGWSGPLSLEVTAYAEDGWYESWCESYPHAVLFGTQSAKTPMMLSEERDIVLALPADWNDCGTELVLERMSGHDEDARPVYVPVEDGSIEVDFVDYAAIVSVGDVFPEAGTYRLTISYDYCGISFAQTQVTFFVNYSGDA